MASDSPTIGFCLTLDEEVDGTSVNPSQKKEMREKVYDVWCGDAPANAGGPSSLDSLDNHCLHELLKSVANQHYTGSVGHDRVLHDVTDVIARKRGLNSSDKPQISSTSRQFAKSEQ